MFAAIIADPAEPAARLRRIAACARDGRPIDPADGQPFADGVDQFFAGAATLDQALGLQAAGRGKPDARRALMESDRDAAMQALAELVGTELGDANSEGVWDIFEILAAFAADKWPRLREAATCPPDLRGADAMAWAIMRARAGVVPPRSWIASFFKGSS